MPVYHRRWLLALALALGTVLLMGGASAAQIATGVYNGLHRGMSESELVLRAGEPDRIVDRGERVVETIRRLPRARHPRWRSEGGGLLRQQASVHVYEYHYVPDHREHDPYLSVITLRGGVVDALQRQKLLTRPAPPTPAPETPDAATKRVPVSDAQLRSERADALLQAARDYARVRERLKAEGASEPPVPAVEPPVEPLVDPVVAPPVAPPPPRLFRGVAPDGSVYFGDRPPAASVPVPSPGPSPGPAPEPTPGPASP